MPDIPCATPAMCRRENKEMAMSRSDQHGNPGSEERQLLSVKQAAEMLATSQRTVWRLLGQGEVAKVQVGRSVRITKASVSAFIARGGAK